MALSWKSFAQLFDFRKKEVGEAQDLSKELTAAVRGSVRPPFDPLVAAGLTPQSLAAMLKNAASGDHEKYLLLAREMEQRDGHYYSVLQTRKMAVAQLPRHIEAPKEGADEKLVDTLTGIINGRGFSNVLINILDGVGKGYSVQEIIWDTAGEKGRLWMPQAIKYRRPQWFRYSDIDGETLMLIGDDGKDVPLAPFKFIVHQPQVLSGLPVAGGLARQVAAYHLFKSYVLRDWMGFAEVFGQPMRIGKFPKGADPADVDTLRQALMDLGADTCAVMPAGMEIQFERAANSGFASGDDFYLKFAEWLNKEISKIVLGQTMTSEDGSSLAQAKVHDDVRKDIRNADAVQLADTINRDLIQPWVDLNFGPRASEHEYPKFCIDTEDPEDLTAFATAIAPFIDRGLPVEAAQVLDKFGLEEPEDGAVLLASNAKNVNEVTLKGVKPPPLPESAGPDGKPKPKAKPSGDS